MWGVVAALGALAVGGLRQARWPRSPVLPVLAAT